MDARVTNGVNSAAGGTWPLNWTTHWEKPMQVTIENVVRKFGTTAALHGISLDIGVGRARGTARSFRLRQDDAAPHPRRPRRADLRPRAVRRRRRAQAHRAAAECRARVPELRALPSHDRARQYRLRLARPSAVAASEPQGDQAPRARAARSRPALRPREALPGPALRRSATARGVCPRARPSSRACSCSTSRSVRSTQRSGAICGAGCASCTTRQAIPPCSSPTTRKRRSSLPTASW